MVDYFFIVLWINWNGFFINCMKINIYFKFLIYFKVVWYFILCGLMNFVLWWKVSNLKLVFIYGSFWRVKINRKFFKDLVKFL